MRGIDCSCRASRRRVSLGFLPQTGLFAQPIYGPEGDYPEAVRAEVDTVSRAEGYRRSRLQTFSPEEVASVKGKANKKPQNCGETAFK